MRDIILERGTETSVAVPHQIPEKKAAFIDLQTPGVKESAPHNERMHHCGSFGLYSFKSHHVSPLSLPTNYAHFHKHAARLWTKIEIFLTYGNQCTISITLINMHVSIKGDKPVTVLYVYFLSFQAKQIVVPSYSHLFIF